MKQMNCFEKSNFPWLFSPDIFKDFDITYNCVSDFIFESTDGWLNWQMDEWIDRQMNELTDGEWIDRRMNEFSRFARDDWEKYGMHGKEENSRKDYLSR